MIENTKYSYCFATIISMDSYSGSADKPIPLLILFEEFDMDYFECLSDKSVTDSELSELANSFSDFINGLSFEK